MKMFYIHIWVSIEVGVLDDAQLEVVMALDKLRRHAVHPFLHVLEVSCAHRLRSVQDEHHIDLLYGAHCV